MFNDNQILQLKIFCQSITSRLIPIDQQEALRDGDKLWCADWWTIEVCKCLFHGRETYLLDPPPNRLKNNPLWNMQDILSAVSAKLNMMKVLKENKDFSDTLFVCEVGRGIDILLASFVKPWQRIICYDNNPLVLDEVDIFFKNKMGLPIESFRMNSGDMEFHLITEKEILVANNSRMGPDQKLTLKNKENILAIIDGDKL